VLNKQRQLWFCRKMQEEQPKWLLLSKGVRERTVSRNSRKIRFYALGSEEYPKEEVEDSVKVISFLLDISEDDEAQREILACHGETVYVVDWILSKNTDNYGKICEATVEVSDDGSGKAEEAMRAEIRFLCGKEQEAEMISGVNGVSFTAKNKEVSDDE